ncbi:hypothetical protein [Paenibacillus aceris]|uniref:Uncharacterized protein n=1 Tax=Paenibacillus aceris TaxID=869555 RepID=A0ABS4I9G2_9BACL|nr:hypothetical protein [Paenibacillus aceris]MBP1967543.1 hypothetical protein [Paenibacillus aceris]NHW36301.1 hypothetical protein [Paenibacillus aceris]
MHGELKRYNLGLYYEQGLFYKMPSKFADVTFNESVTAAENLKETLLRAYRDEDIVALADILDNAVRRRQLIIHRHLHW